MIRRSAKSWAKVAVRRKGRVEVPDVRGKSRKGTVCPAAFCAGRYGVFYVKE